MSNHKRTKRKKARQWTAEDARRVLRAWQASGKSLEVFARQRRLVPQRLYWWRKRLGEWGSSKRTARARKAGFVPAVVVPTRLGASATLRLAGGRGRE